jgi:hypothetical protein
VTDYYFSGTPKNDAFQWLENKFTDHRLFSIHGGYLRDVLRWVRDVKDGIDSVDAFLDRYPSQRHRIEAADRIRRQRQAEQADERDFDTIEVLRAAYPMAAIYPRHIMLDSGAFTVWNAGKRVSVEEVIEAYSAFIEEAGDLFSQIWLINLDEIPGERRKSGKKPPTTPKQMREAAEVADRHLAILRERFGPVVLPVIHQPEGEERLKQVIEQVAGRGDFICLSPDNHEPEPSRIKWARHMRDLAQEIAPEVRLHGLATTGNVMANGFGYYSVDSLAWLQHALYGSLDLYEII